MLSEKEVCLERQAIALGQSLGFIYLDQQDGTELQKVQKNNRI